MENFNYEEIKENLKNEEQELKEKVAKQYINKYSKIENYKIL